MSGRWIRLWDGNKWIDAYVEGWAPLIGGVATTLPKDAKPTLLDQLGKPIEKPKRRIGFGD